MSVLVTTTFSQGAVFYAGETVSCTITFTNPLPTLPKPPSASSSSSSSYSRRSSARLQQPAPRHLQGNANHSRPPSVHSSFEQEQQLPRELQNMRPSRDYEGTVRPGTMSPPPARVPPARSAATRLTSLASSTFSFLTGRLQQSPPAPAAPEEIPTEARIVEWEESKLEDTKLARLDERMVGDGTSGEPIAIELGDTMIPTPRSSVDTHSMIEPFYNDASRRSSMDSLASANPYHGRASQFSAPRLSQILLRSSTGPAVAKKPEHLLWGFAQVVGNFIVDPTLINNNEFAPLKQRTMYRPHGAGMGGGGAFLMGRNDVHSKIDTRTTPVISTPPSILFVDLDLAPGETKKFSYKLKLPNDIPPSHRGKAIRFSYSLVVGTQRANNGLSTGQGQVVQIPFRVLNHVTEDGSRPIYDLMNPVVMYKDEAIVEAFSDDDFKKPKLNMRRRASNKTASDKARDEFIAYVNALSNPTNGSVSFHEITRRESDAYEEPTAEQNQDDEDIAEKRMLGRACAQIVSRITNSSTKAMFDIGKSHMRVAQLHLTKTSYRLGEAVLGVLDFEGAALPTYEVSILLESNEVVESDIALRQPHQIARISRKCYAEHHSFCLSHQRLSFSLPIPTIASPEFQTTGVKLQYYIKLEFIVSQKAVQASTPATSTASPSFIPINVDERHRHYQAAQNINVSTFDCQIPIRVYGAPGGTDRAVYGRPYTFFVQ